MLKEGIIVTRVPCPSMIAWFGAQAVDSSDT